MNRIRTIAGYTALIAIAAACVLIYGFRSTLVYPDILTLLLLAAAMAVVTVTVSVFWLWDHKRVDAIERVLGPVGHVPHCGYCLCLWLAALAVSGFGISPFGDFIQDRFLAFLFSWWALGFLNVLFFEILTVLWFKKVRLEFELRKLYDAKAADTE